MSDTEGAWRCPKCEAELLEPDPDPPGADLWRDEQRYKRQVSKRKGERKAGRKRRFQAATVRRMRSQDTCLF